MPVRIVSQSANPKETHRNRREKLPEILRTAPKPRGSKHEKVALKDVERIDKLFMDVGEAAEHLRKYEEKLMYH